ncbi:MAG: hypothetical protein AAGA48_15635 [Myxococcota bacterium]
MGTIVIVGQGCAQECLGNDPRCDVAWPGGRLTVLAPLQSTEVQTTDPETTDGIWTGRVDGIVDHGTDWSADAIGDRLVIGVPDANGLFVVDAAAPGQLADDPTFEGDGQFGTIVRRIEDADGGSQLFVGAPEADLARGAIAVFRDQVDARLLGAPPMTPYEPDLLIVGETPYDRIGAIFEICDDIDGDGLLDVVVGAPTFQATDACGMAEDPPPNLAGAAFVLRSDTLKEASGEVSICDVADVVWGSELGEHLGASVACAQEALFIGAPWRGRVGGTSEPPTNAGVVYRVPWTALPARAPVQTLGITTTTGERAEARFGAAVATLTLQGRPALLVGSPGFDQRKGRAALYVDDAAAPVAWVDGAASGEQLGRAVLAGDLDGDGVDDVVLGSPDVVNGNQLDVGQLWLWRSERVAAFGGAVDRDGADQTIQGTHAFQRVGRKLSRTMLNGTPVLLIPTRADP